MSQNQLDLENLYITLRKFAKARDWERSHYPKNLSMALAVEAAEILELFQWLNNDEIKAALEDSAFHQSLQHEIADVLLYTFRLADICKVDVLQALEEKIKLNAEKYPV